MKALRSKPAGSNVSAKRSSTSGRIMSPPMPAWRQPDRSRSAGSWLAARRAGEVVAEARAVGDGAAVARDQVAATAPAGARSRAASDSRSRAGSQSGAISEADQAHVVIERQPAHARDRPSTTSRPAGPIMPAILAISASWRDLHAVRLARAARGELDVAEVGRPERPQIDRLLRQRLDHAPCRHARRTAGNSAAASARKPARSSSPRPHRAGGGELAAQLVEIGLLAADADRHRDRHRQQARHTGRRRRRRRSPARCRP